MGCSGSKQEGAVVVATTATAPVTVPASSTLTSETTTNNNKAATIATTHSNGSNSTGTNKPAKTTLDPISNKTKTATTTTKEPQKEKAPVISKSTKPSVTTNNNGTATTTSNGVTTHNNNSSNNNKTTINGNSSVVATAKTIKVPLNDVKKASLIPRCESPDFDHIDIVDGTVGGSGSGSGGGSDRSLDDFSTASHELASKAFQAMANGQSGASASTRSSSNGTPSDPPKRGLSTVDSVTSTSKGMKHSTSKLFCDREEQVTDLKGRVVHIEVPFGKPIEDVYEGVQTGPVLGSGISGLVRLCTHRETQVKYAVKCLDLGLIDNEDQLKQLKEEIYIMCQLDHPNIVRLEEVYESHNEIYLVQELCLGGELFDRLDEQPDYHYTEAQCARLVKQMLCAVRYIHSKGIVHRDLKLENFLFSNTSADSELKMIDFGLSKHFDKFGQVHVEAVGTPYTVAPEVIRGRYDEKCDVWAIGVIAYLLLSGDPPFGGCGGPEPLLVVRQNILSGKFAFEPLDVWSSVSKQAKDFICRLLVTDARKRPTAAEAQKLSWIREWVKKASSHKCNAGQLNPNVVNALVNFKEYSDMRKLLCEVLSFTLLPDQIVGLRDEFEKMDTDGSGEITLSALKQVLLNKSGSGTLGALTEQEVEDIFHAMRVRKDDANPTIQWHEFIAAGLSQCQVDDRNLKLAFDRIDADHKSYISLEDMMDLMGNSYTEESLRDMLRDTLNLSPNEEARITYDDFLRLMKGQAPLRRNTTSSRPVTAATAAVASSSILPTTLSTVISSGSALLAAGTKSMGSTTTVNTNTSITSKPFLGVGQQTLITAPSAVAHQPHASAVTTTKATASNTCHPSVDKPPPMPLLPTIITSDMDHSISTVYDNKSTNTKEEEVHRNEANKVPVTTVPVTTVSSQKSIPHNANILSSQVPNLLPNVGTVSTATNTSTSTSKLTPAPLAVAMTATSNNNNTTNTNTTNHTSPITSGNITTSTATKSNGAGIPLGSVVASVGQGTGPGGGTMMLEAVEEHSDENCCSSSGIASPAKQLSMVGSHDNDLDLLGSDEVEDMSTFSEVKTSSSDDDETPATNIDESEHSISQQDVFVSKDDEAVVWSPSRSAPTLQVSNLNSSMFMTLDDSSSKSRQKVPEDDDDDDDAPDDQHPSPVAATAAATATATATTLAPNPQQLRPSIRHTNSGRALTFDEDDELLGGLENLAKSKPSDDNNTKEVVITSNVGAAIKRLSLERRFTKESSFGSTNSGAAGALLFGNKNHCLPSPRGSLGSSTAMTASEHLDALRSGDGGEAADKLTTPATPPSSLQRVRLSHHDGNGTSATSSPSVNSNGSAANNNCRISPRASTGGNGLSPLSTRIYSHTRRRSRSVDDESGSDGNVYSNAVVEESSTSPSPSPSPSLRNIEPTNSNTNNADRNAISLDEREFVSSFRAKQPSLDAIFTASSSGEEEHDNEDADDSVPPPPPTSTSASTDAAITSCIIGDKNAPPLQVNRELYRAHRLMRLGVMEASKQFEDFKLQRARRQATQESMQAAAAAKKSRAGLVMKHGNTRIVSTEEIRQMLSREEEALSEQVQALSRKTGRATLGGRGTNTGGVNGTGTTTNGTGTNRRQRPARKKTVSDMSGML